ncbi:MAG: hypothetical protein KAG66_24660 [Methylococcales bacterium]|nr:hypothetical protein [Methylococcales bacterium]
MVEPSKVDKIPAVKGSYFLPRRARRRPALLRFAGKHMQLVTPTGERMRFDLADTRVSTPLAKLNFTFHFIDGSLFECPSNVAVHNWLVTQSGHSVQSVAHRLESK